MRVARGTCPQNGPRAPDSSFAPVPQTTTSTPASNTWDFKPTARAAVASMHAHDVEVMGTAVMGAPLSQIATGQAHEAAHRTMRRDPWEHELFQRAWHALALRTLCIPMVSRGT